MHNLWQKDVDKLTKLTKTVFAIECLQLIFCKTLSKLSWKFGIYLEFPNLLGKLSLISSSNSWDNSYTHFLVIKSSSASFVAKRNCAKTGKSLQIFVQDCSYHSTWYLGFCLFRKKKYVSWKRWAMQPSRESLVAKME